MSARTPKYSCGAAGGKPEADEHFVEDQDDIALGADVPQLLGAMTP